MTSGSDRSGSRSAGTQTSAAGSAELARASWLPKPIQQANLAWSRKGVIRGLHYHERGQDDLFVCLQGMVRVVVLDRETGETGLLEDIGDENPVAIYVPGRHAHGFEALTDCLFCYLVTEEYDPANPDEHGIPWNDPAWSHLWSTHRRFSPHRDRARRADHGGRRPARKRARRSSYPRGGGLPARALGRPLPAGEGASGRDFELVLHAAALTDVDGAEDDPQGAAATNVGGTQNVAALGCHSCTSRATTSSTARKGRPTSSRTRQIRSTPTAAASSSARPRPATRAWIVRSSWLFGPVGHNFVRTMLRARGRARGGAVVDDQRGSPTYTAHLAAGDRGEVSGLPYGIYHLAAAGECTWAEFAEAIFAEAGLDCRVRPISSAEFGCEGAAPRLLGARSERGAPELPHWREGLRECLGRLL